MKQLNRNNIKYQQLDLEDDVNETIQDVFQESGIWIHSAFKEGGREVEQQLKAYLISLVYTFFEQ